MGKEEIKKLKFKCPNCGSDELELCEDGCFVSTLISELNDSGDFDYGNPDIQDGATDRFQCMRCAFVLRETTESEPLTDVLEVVEWLKVNCKQED